MTEIQNNTEQQMSLIPDHPPTKDGALVETQDLPTNEQMVSPDPTRELIESIERFGLVHPVVLSLCDGRYRVHSGRRRIKALRYLSDRHEEANGERAHNPYATVQAVVVEDMYGGEEALAVSINATAKPNKIAELEAIENMIISHGATEREIADATGLRSGTIRARMKLSKLHSDLREAMKKSEKNISVGNAEVVANMPEGDQEKVVQVYKEKGRIKAADVKEVRSARKEEAYQTLPWDDITGTPDAPDTHTENDDSGPGKQGYDLGVEDLLDWLETKPEIDGVRLTLATKDEKGRLKTAYPDKETIMGQFIGI